MFATLQLFSTRLRAIIIVMQMMIELGARKSEGDDLGAEAI